MLGEDGGQHGRDGALLSLGQAGDGIELLFGARDRPAPGAALHGGGSDYADFAQSYDPINSFYQSSAGGSYTVQRMDKNKGRAPTAQR